MRHDRRKPGQGDGGELTAPVDGALPAALLCTAWSGGPSALWRGRLARRTRACAAHPRHGALLAPTKGLPTRPALVPPLTAGTIHLTALTDPRKHTHHGVPSPGHADLLVSSGHPLPTTSRRSPTP